MLKEDAAIEQVLSLRAIYSGPEEVVVMAKVRPSPRNEYRAAYSIDGQPRPQNPNPR